MPISQVHVKQSQPGVEDFRPGLFSAAIRAAQAPESAGLSGAGFQADQLRL